VVWVWMENHGYGNVIGSGSAPYTNSLASTYGLATNYYATDHPSLPNYIEATSGGSQGIGDDNGPSSDPVSAPSIFSQLPNGRSRSLQESMPSHCDWSDSGEYVVHHNPMAYYTNLGSGCSNYDVPFGSSPDLSAAFTFVSPNLIDDMHDGTVSDGDNFLRSYIPALMSTPQYQNGSTAIYIVWDEDGSQDGLDQENNHVPLIVISPYTHGVQDATSYTHYSLLATTEELLGLPLLGNAASANSMVGKFGF
jgi:phosphatidylinositol-3-phosphatase